MFKVGSKWYWRRLPCIQGPFWSWEPQGWDRATSGSSQSGRPWPQPSISRGCPAWWASFSRLTLTCPQLLESHLLTLSYMELAVYVCTTAKWQQGPEEKRLNILTAKDAQKWKSLLRRMRVSFQTPTKYWNLTKKFSHFEDWTSSRLYSECVFRPDAFSKRWSRKIQLDTLTIILEDNHFRS